MYKKLRKSLFFSFAVLCFLLLSLKMSAQVSKTVTPNEFFDGTGALGTNVTLPFNYTAGVDFTAGFVVTDVAISITWSRTETNCAGIDALNDVNEVGFILREPNGTFRTLVPQGSWSGTPSGSVTTVFQNTGAAPSGLPVNGTFGSNQTLNSNRGTDFLGVSPFGNWELYVVDNNGNLSGVCVTSATLTLTACDPNPNAICQATLSRNLDAAGTYSPTFADLDNSSVFCTPLTTFSFSPTSLSCSDIGAPVPVTMTITTEDASGNIFTDNCITNITVSDITLPVARCQNISVNLDATGNVTVNATQLDNITTPSTDNCSVASYLFHSSGLATSSFNCTNIGLNNVLLRVTDPSLNIRTCGSTITVVDNTNPVARCQNINAVLDATGNVTVNAQDVDDIATPSSDNCTISSYLFDVSGLTTESFNCTNLGANNLTLRVTDQSGNTNTCATTITVVDNINPVAICQNISVNLDATGNVTVNANSLDNTATPSTDNCSISTYLFNGSGLSTQSFNCSNTGVNTVTLRITDQSGNTNTCSADITVVDNINPVARCQNISVNLDATGNVTVNASQLDNTVTPSTDNCSPLTFLFDASGLATQSFNCTNTGVNTVTLRVTDPSGNTNTCSADITVVDNTNPVARCQNINATLDATGNVTVNAQDIDDVVTPSSDNCSISSYLFDVTGLGTESFDCTDLGANNVTLRVTDPSGNTNTCLATITVVDNINPVARCQNINATLDATGNVTVNAQDIDDVVTPSSDNCSISSYLFDATGLGTESFDCTDLGANNLTLRVTDPAGNTNTCVATITVVDNTNPVARCQNINAILDATGNVTVNATDLDDVANLSSDNCSISSYLFDATGLATESFDCTDLGANNVTLRVTDQSGNTSTCASVITVVDNINPVANCQNISVNLDALGNFTVNAQDLDNTATPSTDNCTISSYFFDATGLATQTFDCSALGINNVTLRTTDQSGNVGTCSAIITVVDNIAPTAICQNITVSLNAAGEATVIPSDVDNSSTDNCTITTWSFNGDPIRLFTCADTGVNNVTLTITDQSGNNATCLADVTVVNTVVPVVVNDTVCSGNSVVLTASTAAGSITWYDDVLLTNQVGSGVSFTTPILTNTTDYFVTRTINGCEGPAATLTVTVLPTPVPPAVVTDTVCMGSTANLSATGSTGTINWYDASMTNILATGNTFTTNALSQNTTYFVIENDGFCNSTAVAVNVVVESLPANPTVNSPISVCSGDDVVLSATGSGTGNLVFHDSAFAILTGGSIPMSGVPSQTFNLGVLNSGNYTFYVTENNGSCSSSPVALSVEVKAATALPFSAGATICAGSSTTLNAIGSGQINWYEDSNLSTLLSNSNSFTTPVLNATTNYFLTQTVNGCESSSLQIAVTVNTAPSNPVVVTDTVCAGANAQLSATGTGGTLTWYSDPAALNVITTGAVLNLSTMHQTTYYFVSETDNNGCESALTSVELFVLPKLNEPSSNAVEVCSGTNVELTATGSGNGELVFFDAAQVALDTIAMNGTATQISNQGQLAAGNYTFYVAEQNSNCISDLTSISVNVKAIPATPSVNNDSPVCEGEDVFLQTPFINGAVYNWSGPNGFVANQQNVLLENVSSSLAGSYTLNVEVNGCVSADSSTTVNINARPVVSAVSNNGPLCQGETLELTAPTIANCSYSWSGPLGFTSTNQNPTISNVSESEHQGFYQLIATDTTTGCTSEMVSTIVMINNLPQVGLVTNTGPACEGDQVTLLAASILGATYSWEGPNGFTSTDRTPVLTNLTVAMSGTYNLSVTVDGCTQTTSTDLVVLSVQNSSISPDVTVEKGETVQLNATGGVSYSWSPADYLSSTVLPNPVMNAQDTGVFTYEVLITDVNGCRTTLDVTVTVEPSDNPVIPDLFTPNADGINDVWQVDFLQVVSESTVQIYSRGGLEVFRSENYQNDFDGTQYKTGKTLPDGTYFYIIRLTDGTEYKGPVTIKR